jgi:DUF971 family protein
MTDLHPNAIRKAGADSIAIDWSDGHKSIYTFAHLRANCPCAGCRDERDNPEPGHGHSHEHGHGHDHGGEAAGGPAPMIGLPLAGSPPPGPPTIKEVNPVGRYAYSLVWSDGHMTGIFAFTFLRTLCECAECRGLRGSA